MARPSPLIIACLGVGAVVLGFEVAAIYRSHHRPPVAGQETAAEEPEPAAAAPPPPPPVAPGPAAADSPPPAAPPAAPPIAAPAPEVPAQRPQFTSPDIDTVIRTADERVFDELAMPEVTRAAIRRLNEEHQQKLRVLRAEGPGGAGRLPLNGNQANVTAFRQTRHEALQELLGADTGIRFERAERTAAKRLHNQIRAEALGGVSPPAAPPTVQ